MFINPTSIPIEPIQKNLLERCKHRSSYELNFICNNNEEIACFIAGPQTYSGLFFVTDDRFTPKLIYKTTAYINACAISDYGKYAICQTAYNKVMDEDSGAFIVLDILKPAVIGKLKIETGWKGLTHLYVDENKQTFFAYYGDRLIEYDFDGKPCIGK